MRLIRLFLLLLAFSALPLAAQTVPTTINYQGRLTDNTPSQVPINATVQMQFALYDAASGGTRLWQEPAADNTGTSVTVTTGIFNYVLGNTIAIPASAFTGATSVRYLQITLNPAGSAEILTPRQLITATGYSDLAQNANNSADSAKLGGIATSGWQRALSAQSCSAGSFYSSITQSGTVVCTPPTVLETDPKVGTLSDGAIPVWSDAQGSLVDLATPVSLALGGTGANLSATGGASQYVKQSTAGGALTVGAIPAADVPNLDAAKITTGTLPVARGGSNSGTALSGTTIMISNGSAVVQGTAGTTSTVLHGNAAGAPSYGAVALGTEVSGNLPIANAPTGGAWTLTSNLNLDSNTLVVDQANNRVGIGAAAPLFPLDVSSAFGNTHARFGTTNPIFLVSNNPNVGFNADYNGGWIYATSNFAGSLQFTASSGDFIFQSAPSGVSGATATMTTRFQVSNTGAVTVPSPGTLSIGVRLVTCTITTPIQNCACAAGETVVSGGAYGAAGNSLRESRPTSTSAWVATCMNNAGTDVNCGGMFILCDRRAP